MDKERLTDGAAARRRARFRACFRRDLEAIRARVANEKKFGIPTAEQKIDAVDVIERKRRTRARRYRERNAAKRRRRQRRRDRNPRVSRSRKPLSLRGRN
jgi:hypothetical protein